MKLRWLSLIVIGVALAGCLNPDAKSSADAKPAGDSAGSATTTKMDPNAKTTWKDTKPGTGEAVAADGDLLLLEYTGKLASGGKQFDTNRKPDGSPFPVTLGGGGVIAGFEKGLKGLKSGGERTINIPAVEGYGESGSGDMIPPNSDLVFDVKVLAIIKKGQEGDWHKDILKPGTGTPAKKGDKLTVHYTGTLLNGKKFDSSKDRNEPFDVTLGAGGVIQGWEVGLEGIKQGEVRRLWIPPALGYRDQGSPPNIPGPQVLIFEIECLKIEPGK